MLGRSISDPACVESQAGWAAGLNLFPAQTTLMPTKQTRAVSATTPGGTLFGGYEIHVGVTALDAPNHVPFATLEDGTADGARADRVLGTYLHGAFEHPMVCAEVFGIEAPSAGSKAADYRRLGQWFETHGRHLDRLGFF
jgi:cobyric acid synthase